VGCTWSRFRETVSAQIYGLNLIFIITLYGYGMPLFSILLSMLQDELYLLFLGGNLSKFKAENSTKKFSAEMEFC
jgi:hypothetical protein